MPIYSITALDDRGRIVKDSISATDKQSALLAVTKSGLYVREISRQYNFSLRNHGLDTDLLFRLIRSFKALLSAGLSISEALDALADVPENDKVSQFMDLLIKGVNRGESLSEIAAANGHMFDRLLVNAFRTGEKSGNLTLSLDSYLENLQQKRELSSNIRNALSYPIFLLGALVIVMFLLFVYVIPNFSEMFDSFGAELPAPTKVIMLVANNFHWVILGSGLLAVLLVAISRAARTSVSLHLALDKVLLSAPLLSSLRRKIQVSNFSLMLKSLLDSGAPLVEALSECRNAFEGTALGESIESAKTDILDGQSIYNSFKRNHVLSGYSLKMLGVGEKASSIEKILSDIARFHSEELTEFLSRFNKILEPALILLMGLMMGFVIIAMYLPIFYMADVVK